jgi:hypothetical protein
MQPDSIKTLTDSSAIQSAGVIQHADSLAKLDSLHVLDSLRAIVPIPRGFLGIPHPSIPQTESWVFIFLLVLFGLLMFSLLRSSGLLIDSAKNFFQIKERSSIFSQSSVTDFRYRLYQIFFSAAVLSFYAYSIQYDNSTPFSIVKYLFFLLVTLLFLGLKALSFELIGYVFLNPKTLKTAKDSYFNVIILLGILMFPILVFQIYSPSKLTEYVVVFSLIVSVGAYLLIIVKLFQIFFHKIVVLFYILLYLCTLEFLPFYALYRAYQFFL